jgi:hypothetical protein
MASRGTRPEASAYMQAVEGQLARLLAHPLFNQSKRYPLFLKYIVKQTLSGHSGDLKERIIGIEVFGRKPDYDTNVDHMVRNVAAEVRKRLSEYYSQPEHKAELRVEFPPGSYVPCFGFPSQEMLTKEPASESPVPLPAAEPALSAASRPLPGRRSLFWVAAGVLVSVIAAGGGFLWFHFRQTALERFWSPVLSSSHPVAICLAGPGRFAVEQGPDIQGPPETIWSFQRSRDLVAFSDSVTLALLAGYLEASGKPFRTLLSADSRISDLRTGPLVLIGTGDDELVRLLSAPLRFHFEHAGTSSFITDSKNPGRTNYVVDWRTPLDELVYDYSIVWRVQDSFSGKTVIGAAGITRLGSAAAGEFLTSPDRMSEFERRTPGVWNNRNIEILLRVQLARGSSFRSEILATHVW